MKRKLFVHEQEVHSWRSMTLTTHRIIHLEARHGFDGSTSIPLEHLQWTRIARSHRPTYAIVAGTFAAFGLYLSGQGTKEVAYVALALALVMLLMYLGTRQAMLILASGGGRIELPIGSGTNTRQKARDFLDAIEHTASVAGRHRQVPAVA